MKSELERFETFAYDALQNDGWDDIEVDYYHSDIPPHDVYGVPIRLFKRDSDEESGAEAKYQLVMKCFCHRSGEDAYDIRLWVGADDPYGKKCNSFDEFKKCYEEALVIVKRDNIKESLDFVDAIDFANNLRPYEEGPGDVVHKVGTGIKNFFGTKAGAAQRAAADAQTAQQTAQNQAAANQANASLVPAQQAAQQILKTLQNDITKTKVGNVVKGAAGAVGKGLATAAKGTGKFVAGAVAAAGDAIINQNSNAITRKAAFQNGVEKTQNAIDNGEQKAKDLKDKVSSVAHGEAKTASEQENAKNQNGGK